jgi:hypothetical protein
MAARATANWLKPEKSGMKQDPVAPIQDRTIRLILIPTFGLAIPHLTGYFGPYGPSSAIYWIGLLWAMAISFVIWHGNRAFLLRQRQHLDWFRHPVRKICILAFACIFYTAPVTVAMMLAWYAIAGLQPEWRVIQIVTLACVICVAFITHVYETVYLIQQRETDLVAVEKLERARTQAELDALKAQVAPHFLFNSLNTLPWLIENDSPRAVDYTHDLADVYRYILVSGKRELVPLSDEFEFLDRYCALLRLRFPDSLAIDIGAPQERWHVPPMSLQILVENAVKHNEHSEAHPLRIRIECKEQRIRVTHRKRLRTGSRPSAGTGLATLDERCRLTLGHGIDVVDGTGVYEVTVPARIG